MNTGCYQIQARPTPEMWIGGGPVKFPILDEDGNFITDEDGNKIAAENHPLAG
jgi:hypothetical protein